LASDIYAELGSQTLELRAWQSPFST